MSTCAEQVPTPAAESGSVRGERGATSVNSARSLQSRVSSVLAAGLMIALGVGGLSWYYANALATRSHARQAAVSAVANSAQGEMALPPLGAVAPQRGLSAMGPSADLTERGRMSQPGGEESNDTPAAVVTTGWTRGEGSHVSGAGVGSPGGSGSIGAWNGAASPLSPYPGVGAPVPTQRPQDRRLSGIAFAHDSSQMSSGQGLPAGGAAGAGSPSAMQAGALALLAGGRGPGEPPSGDPTSGGRGEDALATLLRPVSTAPARAVALPTQQFLLPKGAFIDCTLETAIDSTLPGMVTCVAATDTFGVDGKVVLLERGSKLVGETRGEVRSGAARVFVLWTEARTPTGVLVPLDSPGTDELGRSGLPGEVDRHFWDRFGAALLVSVIDGGMQAAAQSANRGGGAVIYNPGASADALTDVLKGTINVAPTVTKHQGDRIQILVARDLDFRSVYELRTAVR